MDDEQLELLEEFVELCKIKPSVLQSDKLKFFRDWLIELGATLPTEKQRTSQSHSTCEEPEPMEEEVVSEESDIEISNDGIIKEDEANYEPIMGDESIEVTEEMQDSADEKRNEALSQFREGNYDEAIKLFTDAIKLYPTCAMLYAKRASCYVKLKCPNAAIKDCNKCFELNPDSALAYKWRGISLKLLGKWEESFADLTQSLKLDYADDTHEYMKEVESKAKLIKEHKRKYERKREEKLLNEKRERIRRAQEANEKAKKSNTSSRDFGDLGGQFKGMGGGGGGGCGGGMPAGLGDLLSDPELVEDLKDPEVMAALSEIMSNPASLMKHQGNPKITKILSKMQSKFGGAGGGGGCCGESSGAAGGHSCPMDTEEGTGHRAKPPHKSNIADDLD